MLRPLLLSTGSRGDVEPLLALVSTLIKSAQVEHILLCIPSDYASFAPKSSHVTVHALPFNQDDLYRNFTFGEKAAVTTAGRDCLKSIQFIGQVIRSMILPHTGYVLKQALQLRCNLVLTTLWTQVVGEIVSEVLNSHLVLLHFQPMTPSHYYPNILTRGHAAAESMRLLLKGDTDAARNAENWCSHIDALDAAFADVLPDLNALRATYSLAPIDMRHILDIMMAKDENTHVLEASPSQLSPQAPDAPIRYQNVGSLAAAFMPTSLVPEVEYAELASFLSSGPPPVVVTYGSMSIGCDSAEVTHRIMQGLRAAQVERVVLLPGRAQLGLHLSGDKRSGQEEVETWSERHVWIANGNVQYPWLFPQCSMVFCHCGAGTVSAALRAGLPVLGTPVASDQLFFVKLLQDLKLGVHVGAVGFSSITADAVEKAVYAARGNEIVGAVRSFSVNEFQGPNSCEKACSIIEEIASETRET